MHIALLRSAAPYCNPAINILLLRSKAQSAEHKNTMIAGPLTSCQPQAREWRRYEASELLPIAEREARSLGAVRPSNLEGLDELETPVWQVVRPNALDVAGNVTVLTGKAWSEELASLGAYMEF